MDTKKRVENVSNFFGLETSRGFSWYRSVKTKRVIWKSSKKLTKIEKGQQDDGDRGVLGQGWNLLRIHPERKGRGRSFTQFH